MEVVETTCEYAANPLGVDAAEPRFGWVLQSSRRGSMQAAYHILVAWSPDKLENELGDKWDSGKVASDQSVNIVYEGSRLTSGEKCYWKVRVWDDDGKVSEFSQPASFEMGLLKEGDWKGGWIGAKPSVSSPLLRREFEIAGQIKQARAYISGLGWHELYINGRKVGDHVLDPAPTDYDKRILYVTHDVTDLLRKGPNAVGVMLGNGWFCAPSALRYGDSPRLLLQINVAFADGSSASIITDRSWKVSPGPITHNDLYGGESYDARFDKPGWHTAGYDDSDWAAAILKDAPGGRLESQLMPAIKVNKTIQPIKITNPKPGVFVYDMGQLFGGWAGLRVKGPKGTKIALKYSSRIQNKTGLVDQDHYQRHHWFNSLSPGPNETDTYILKGDPQGEVYEPRFTYHPVRYIQIEGYPGQPTRSDLEGRVVYSTVDLFGDFQCSNPLFNQIHQNVSWTLTNELYGIPLDCLHREPWAWVDPATIAATLHTRKHMPLFWMKWLDDIKHSQDERGMIPCIAPRYNVKPYEDPAWALSYLFLVWYYYQYYEDKRILMEHYTTMKKLVDYFESVGENHIVTEGLLGDHMLPGSQPGQEEYVSKETPSPLLWSGYHYRGARILAQVAEVLGNAKDTGYYSKLAAAIKDAINEKWFDRDTNQYATGSQTANLLPLAVGIVPEENVAAVLANVIRDIQDKHGGHLHTGNIGTLCMINVLTRLGYGGVMYEVANKTDYPSWGYMIKEGATTIWETWGLYRFGQNERHGGAESMIMWAIIDEFFYNDLAGIKGPDFQGPYSMAPGFRQVEIKPFVHGELTHAAASIKTVRGIVSSIWQKEDDSISFEISIPVNSQARVNIPKMGLEDITITESDQVVWRNGSYVGGVEGISGGSEDADCITLSVGSGSYCFELQGAPSEARLEVLDEQRTTL